MAYDLRAIIGRSDAVASVSHPAFADPVELAQGFALRPLRDRSGIDAFDADDVRERLAAALAPVSDGADPIAVVGIETFGGPSADCAVVWHGGRVIFAEAVEDDAEMFPSQVAFRLLGVRAAPGLDEFDTLGLGRHRSTDEWYGGADRDDDGAEDREGN
jgi:hypothetical protein